MFIKAVIITILMTFSACSSMFSSASSSPAVSIDSVRGNRPPNLVSQKVDIDRDRYIALLQGQGVSNQARLIEIYHRGVPSDTLKEYRLLDVRRNSVYDELGLKQGDVIVAADNFVIPNPDMFWNYLNLMARLEESTIEIRRNGIAMLFQYSFS